MVNKYNLTSKVAFLGFQTNPYNILKKSDLLFLTSRWEGFGHVIIESLICNTPVITFNSKGSVNELINNEAGWKLNNNSIDRLALEVDEIIYNKKYIHMPKLNNTYYNKFNIKNIVEEYLAILNK